jgi:hypothetical protein
MNSVLADRELAGSLLLALASSFAQKGTRA